MKILIKFHRSWPKLSLNARFDYIAYVTLSDSNGYNWQYLFWFWTWNFCTNKSIYLRKTFLIQEYHVKIKIYKKHTCTGTNVVSDIQVSFHYTQMLWQITEEKKGQVILWRNSHFPSQVVMTINLFNLIESSRAYSFHECMFYPTNNLLVSIFTGSFYKASVFWDS